MSKRVFFTLIFTLSFLQLFSTTYYVAPASSGGSDSNAGTLAAPFETFTILNPKKAQAQSNPQAPGQWD